MDSLQHQTISDNPCNCRSCSDRGARDLAAQLGMAPADGPDDDLDLAAEHADRIAAHAAAVEAIRWGLWNPIFKRPADDDEPGQLARDWEPPISDEDREWWAAETAEGGCGIDELSPDEEEALIWGEDEWVRACREHAQWVEEQEQEAAYHEMIGRLSLGGHSSDW